MKYVIVISNDSRSLMQVSRCASELKDETTIEVFKNLEDFESFLNPKEEIAGAPPPTTEQAIEKKHHFYVQSLLKEKGLNLVIVDHEALGTENPVTVIQKMSERLKALGFEKNASIIRFILLSFDSNASHIDTLASPAIDDVILKPIDNQLFLQKLSMVLADKRTSAGEFLYKQNFESNIYLAQSATMEELSDIGVAIRSKKPRKDGLIIRVFAKVFGSRENSSILLRTFKSIAHPKIEGEYLVYYTYYGINSSQIQRVRKVLLDLKPKRQTTLRGLSPTELTIFKKNKKRIAIIAFNQQTRLDIESTLKGTYINLETNSYPSLAAFAKKVGVQEKLGDTATSPASAIVGRPEFIGPPAPVVEPTMAFVGDYSFTINQSGEVTNVITKKTQFFDLNAAQMFVGLRKWLNYIHPEDLAEVEEFLNHMRTTDKGQTFARLKNPSGETHFVRLAAEAIAGETPPQIKLQFTEYRGEAGMKTWQTARQEFDATSGATDLDAIFIDASGITEAAEIWGNHIKGFLESTKLIQDGKKISIIALLPEKLSVKLDEFKKTFFSDVLLTPIDRKLMIDKANLHVPGLYSQYGLNVVQLEPYPADIKVAQEVKMEMASEFGVEIRSNQPIREGVFLRLFSPLFLDENYDGILARSYSTKIDEKNKDEHHNVFSFYGISDAFLKHIRKWIRETYISQKEPKE